jgi:hypothetical protein
MRFSRCGAKVWRRNQHTGTRVDENPGPQDYPWTHVACPNQSWNPLLWPQLLVVANHAQVLYSRGKAGQHIPHSPGTPAPPPSNHRVSLPYPVVLTLLSTTHQARLHPPPSGLDILTQRLSVTLAGLIPEGQGETGQKVS